jgi:DNA-binding NarL/FixJ family response regulator
MESSVKEIIIADNQFLIIRSLAEFIREKLQLDVRQVVNTRQDLERSLSAGSLSLLIIDICHFDFDGIADLQKTLALNSSVRVLVLTNSLTRTEITELNSIGIKNILFKSADEEELMTAIENTLRGKKYHGHEVMDILMEGRETKKSFHENTSLTGSEIEIVRLIAEGLTTKEIASRKNVSFHTIITHRKNIFRKLKVNNASELVMFAIRTGIIDTVDYQI